MVEFIALGISIIALFLPLIIYLWKRYLLFRLKVFMLQRIEIGFVDCGPYIALRLDFWVRSRILFVKNVFVKLKHDDFEIKLFQLLHREPEYLYDSKDGLTKRNSSKNAEGFYLSEGVSKNLEIVFYSTNTEQQIDEIYKMMKEKNDEGMPLDPDKSPNVAFLPFNFFEEGMYEFEVFCEDSFGKVHHVSEKFEFTLDDHDIEKLNQNSSAIYFLKQGQLSVPNILYKGFREK